MTDNAVTDDQIWDLFYARLMRSEHRHNLVKPQRRLLCGNGDRDSAVEWATAYGYYGA